MSETVPITTVRVRWINSETHEIEIVEAEVSNPHPSMKGVMEFEALGCTSRAQALRLAKWTLANGPEVKA